MYRPRSATARLQRLLEQFPAVVVAGARQVGKSTLLRHLFDGRADIVVFDPVLDVENARAEPDLFLEQHGTPLVLDEIQYAPELVPALKRWIDRDRRPGRYVLTGSQQWEVLRALSESLAGRVAFLDLEGFSLAEMAGAVDEAEPRPSWLERWLDSPQDLLESRPTRLEGGRPLFDRLWRGSLPDAELLDEDVVPELHAAYERTYIERDARLIGEVDDWQLFGRFFRMVCASTAQEINHSKLGRELGISPQTSRRWLDMLVATFQWHEVPAWSGNTLKRVSKKPKGFLADTGTVCAAMRISSPAALADHPAIGAIHETAVVGEIRRLASVLTSKPILHHWRTHAGAEVDLILERDGVLHPIEIRSTTHPRPSDVRGIRSFRDTYPRLRVGMGLVLAPTSTVVRLTPTDAALPWDLAPR
ncbi:MAG: ATP-binding protein [Planctomycetota bacterium]